MDLERPNDIELMERLKKGQTQAFDLLVARYQQPLFGFFQRMGVGLADREDLVQDVFLRLFSSRSRYTPCAKFTTFLYTLARHVWVDYRRKNGKRQAVDLEETNSGLAPNEDFLWKDNQMDVQEALEFLPEKLRMVVVMSIYQALKYQEIAEILEIPVGTVKSRMHFALKQLKETLSAKETRQRRD